MVSTSIYKKKDIDVSANYYCYTTYYTIEFDCISAIKTLEYQLTSVHNLISFNAAKSRTYFLLGLKKLFKLNLSLRLENSENLREIFEYLICVPIINK